MSDLIRYKESNPEFAYMMLGRLQMDLDYYFGFGDRNATFLFFDTLEEQITEITHLFNSFPEYSKPEWFTAENIKRYQSLSAIEIAQ